MKRNYTFLLSLIGIFNISQAQDNGLLLNNLEKKRSELVEKYRKLNTKEKKIKGEDKISSLAGFVENTPYYYSTLDNRVNKSIGAEALQEGVINGLKLEGKDISILVVDGGIAFGEHIEFKDVDYGKFSRIYDLENGASSYSSHATSVSSFIGAVGGVTFSSDITSKGVLPKAKILNYDFHETSNGDVFKKIVLANQNISNHSYGINVGWEYDSEGTTDNRLGPGWYYTLDNHQKSFNDVNATVFGTYYADDKTYDKIVYENPNYILVKSSGNFFGKGPTEMDKKYYYGLSGWVEYEANEIYATKNCDGNNSCIGFGSLAKNIIVVGSSTLPTTSNFIYDNPVDYKISGFSSAGPRKDGGIKPDISTYGESLYAAGYNSSSLIPEMDYIRGSGTSYSAPIVTGGIGMLTEFQRLSKKNKDFEFFADEAKVIVLHSADEAGKFPGPDVHFGWGLLNVKKAVEILLNTNTIFERKLKKSGTDITYEIVSDGTPLKASISWIDPEIDNFTTVRDMFYNNTSRLVNDFDIRVVDVAKNTTFLPWKLNLANPRGAAIKGDNTVDNYEQVLIENPTKGAKYKVVISNKGTLVNNKKTAEDQNVSILITGATTSNLNVNEIDLKNEISLYPTLATSQITIDTNQQLELIELFDVSGKKILESKSKKIDVTNLPRGVYIVNIKTNQTIVSKKIVKQ